MSQLFHKVNSVGRFGSLRPPGLRSRCGRAVLEQRRNGEEWVGVVVEVELDTNAKITEDTVNDYVEQSELSDSDEMSS